MAVISNLNTRQNPIASGRTGTQVIKFIDAPRVYIKAVDSTPTPITVKSNGTVPTGYTDLGIVNGKVKITYTKEVKEVRTGLDQILRQTYVGKKTANFEFQLSQFDDVVLEKLSGVTPSVLTAGSIVQFGIGNEDVVQNALLLVVQNKLDGKEIQFYNPDAFISFNIQDAGEETVVVGSGNLPAFAWGGGNNEALMVVTDFA
jgi:hypothetical protein